MPILHKNYLTLSKPLKICDRKLKTDHKILNTVLRTHLLSQNLWDQSNSTNLYSVSTFVSNELPYSQRL